MRDDGLLWPKHIVSLHESMEYVMIRPIISEVSLKTLLHTYNKWQFTNTTAITDVYINLILGSLFLKLLF
jgi:hypothetical protein